MPLKDMKGNLYPSMKNGKWGYVNDKNKFIINPVFDKAENFQRVGASDGSVLDVAKIRIGNVWGYLSREGVFFIEPSYDYFTDFDVHSIAFALKDGTYTMFGVAPSFSTNLGEKIVKPVVLENGFNDVPQFSFSDYAIARKDGKYGILKASGKWLVPNEFNSIGKDSSFNMYKLERDGLIGYASYDGTVVFPAEFKSIGWFAQDVIIADNGKIGLFKPDGSVIIPAEYDSIDHFASNLILTKDRKLGLASMDGNIIIPVEFYAIEQMQDGQFMVSGADGFNIYGANGVALFPSSFDFVVQDPKLGYIVEKDGLYGRLDDHGKYMFPCIFESVPDPEHKGYVEMIVDGEPYIFLAGESAPRKVSDYDDELYRRMSDRSYAASTLLPAWLKGHLGRGRIENKPILKNVEPDWLWFDDEKKADYNKLVLKCGKKLADIVPFEWDYFGVQVFDRGDLVFLLAPEEEMFATMYVVNTASGKVSTIGMEDLTKVFSLEYGIAAESYETGDGPMFPVELFYNLNPGMASEILVCYTFHSWAGEIDVQVSPCGERLYTPAVSGKKISMMTEGSKPVYDKDNMAVHIGHSTVYSGSGSYYTYEMLIHEPAENGIAVYEIIGTRHYWKLNRGVIREIRKDNPATVAYGFIGLGVEYFVQPLFLEAKGFDGDKASIRIGSEWLSLTKEQIAAFDPFVQPL